MNEESKRQNLGEYIKLSKIWGKVNYLPGLL